MKKLLTILFTLCMILALAACSAQPGKETSSSGQETATEGLRQDAASDDNEEQESTGNSNAAQTDVAETEEGNAEAEAESANPWRGCI